MNCWQEFASRLRCDVPLGRRTWFQLGGNARFEFQPRDEADLAAIIRRAREVDTPLKVLGAGANVLVNDDGFDGVVVRLDDPHFKRVERKGAVTTVGGGVDLMRFAKECSRRGLSGLECMAGIPASLGGAVKMNAGGRFGEIGDMVRSVRVVRPDGSIGDWPRRQLGLSYRHSEIGDAIVVSVDLELKEDDPVRTRRAFEECFEYKKRTQPLADNSAGCIFKNPPGQSAGAMIDRAGLKGARCGAARVSERHANFIVAEKGAKSADVLQLIDLIRERVRSDFQTELDLEIEVWGSGNGRGGR